MKKILIDSDVCLDSITGRYPYSVHADKILQLAEEKTVEAYVSAESFSNMFYILRKLSTSQMAINVLKDLRSVVRIATVDQVVIDSALNSGWKDFEDAIQFYSATRESCDSIITRNVKHFKRVKLPVYQPTQFLELFNDENP